MLNTYANHSSTKENEPELRGRKVFISFVAKRTHHGDLAVEAVLLPVLVDLTASVNHGKVGFEALEIGLVVCSNEHVCDEMLLPRPANASDERCNMSHGHTDCPRRLEDTCSNLHLVNESDLPLRLRIRPAETVEDVRPIK